MRQLVWPRLGELTRPQQGVIELAQFANPTIQLQVVRQNSSWLHDSQW
jgi:hypothetical protein